MTLSNYRIAIICDWLVTYAGAERVIENILKIVPHADLFSTIDHIPSEKREFLLNKPSTTTFIQRFPFSKTKYPYYLLLMPFALAQLDLSRYDIIISCHHAVSKSVITGPDQLHICYCNSPIRYAWDLQHQYLSEAKLNKGLKGLLAKWMLHKARQADLLSVNHPDYYLANSKFISRRIQKVWRRPSTPLYPPVNTDIFTLETKKQDFYLTSSRLVPYKKIDLIVETFSHFPDKRLVVIGDGPEWNKIKSKASSNVELLGYQPTSVLVEKMQKAKAFVFAAEEDFGISPIEAMACGTPVIALGKGGTLETVKPRLVGLHFTEQSVESLSAAIKEFEQIAHTFNPHEIRKYAETFSNERFQREFEQFVNKKIEEFFSYKNT